MLYVFPENYIVHDNPIRWKMSFKWMPDYSQPKCCITFCLLVPFKNIISTGDHSSKTRLDLTHIFEKQGMEHQDIRNTPGFSMIKECETKIE